MTARCTMEFVSKMAQSLDLATVGVRAGSTPHSTGKWRSLMKDNNWLDYLILFVVLPAIAVVGLLCVAALAGWTQ